MRPTVIDKKWPIRSTKSNRRDQEYKAGDIYWLPYKIDIEAQLLELSRSIWGSQQSSHKELPEYSEWIVLINIGR